MRMTRFSRPTPPPGLGAFLCQFFSLCASSVCWSLRANTEFLALGVEEPEDASFALISSALMEQRSGNRTDVRPTRLRRSLVQIAIGPGSLAPRRGGGSTLGRKRKSAIRGPACSHPFRSPAARRARDPFRSSVADDRCASRAYAWSHPSYSPTLPEAARRASRLSRRRGRGT
jgi:hypothetical protein